MWSGAAPLAAGVEGDSYIDRKRFTKIEGIR